MSHLSKLYPPDCPNGISQGEKLVFKLLCELPVCYSVVHSVYLPWQKGYSDREIDFVVLCQEGILCLEVKGGHLVYNRRCWVFLDRWGRPHESNRSPFAQAKGAMGTLRATVEKAYPKSSLSRTLYAYGVMLPQTTLRPGTPGEEPEVTYDASVPPEEILDYVSRVFDYGRNRLGELTGIKRVLTPGEIDKVLTLLLSFQDRKAQRR